MDNEKEVAARAPLPRSNMHELRHNSVTGYDVGWENKDAKYETAAWAFKAWARFKEGEAKIYGTHQHI